jgi:hypothetical protein
MDIETTVWKKNRLEEKKKENDLANREQFQNNTEFPQKRKQSSNPPIIKSIYDTTVDNVKKTSDESMNQTKKSIYDGTVGNVKKTSDESINQIKKTSDESINQIKKTNEKLMDKIKNLEIEKKTKNAKKLVSKNFATITKKLQDSVVKDFADKELSDEIKTINGFQSAIKNKSKNDKWCKDNPQMKYITTLRSLVLYLKYPIIYIDYAIKKMGIIICNVFSNNKAKDSDKRLVISRIKELIYVFISMYIVYNWFFILCFKYNDGKQSDPVNVSSININMFDNTKWGFLIFLNKVFKYFFEFIIAPVALLDYAFTSISRGLFDYIKLVNMKWVLLFIIISSSFTAIGPYLKELFFQSLQVYFARDDPSKTFGKKSTTCTTFPFFHTLIAGSYIKSFWENSEVPVFLVMVIFNAIGGLIRMAFSHFNVSLAAIFVCVYLFIYSFLAIPIYSKKSLFDTMKMIEKFIQDSNVEKPELKTCDAPDECKQKTIFEYLFDILRMGSNVIYKSILTISIIITLFISIIKYALKIENNDLKMSLIMSSLVIILFAASTKAQQIYNLITKDKKE